MTQKQIIIDFIEGRNNAREFVASLITDDGLLDWIQSNMPLKRCSQKKAEHVNEHTGFECVESVPFDIRIELKNKLAMPDGFSLGDIIRVHDLLYCCFTENFPYEEIHVNTALEEKFDFILSNTPVCIGGNGVDVILEEIYEVTASCQSKAERIRTFRKMCKERFHIENRRYPRWIPCAQWPLSNDGEPLRFLRQKEEMNGECELTTYYFIDSVTDKEITVHQFR